MYIVGSESIFSIKALQSKVYGDHCRSVKPKSERPERKSMVDDPRITVTEEHQNNNNESPKSRRRTFVQLLGIKKGKGMYHILLYFCVLLVSYLNVMPILI